jgi:hypothetical protein
MLVGPLRDRVIADSLIGHIRKIAGQALADPGKLIVAADKD